jgi:hypothetical protein
VEIRSVVESRGTEVLIEARSIQKCRIECVHIRFSPYTNSVRIIATKGAFDSGCI